jgi:hypothetical protein
MAVFGLLSLQILVPRQFARVCHSVNMKRDVNLNHVVVTALHNYGKSYSQIFKLLKPLKISIRQLNIMRNSGGLMTRLSQDA